MRRPDIETFEIVLRSEGHNNPPAIIRLRRLLKVALRGFGLRCVTIREMTLPQVQETEADDPF